MFSKCSPASPALVVRDLLAVRPGLSGAVRGFLHLAAECLRHPGALGRLRHVVPELLLVAAGHVRHDELDVFLYQLALLPAHGLTLVSPRPDLKYFSNFLFLQ